MKNECKYGFYTCSFIGQVDFCNTCDEGQNYQMIMTKEKTTSVRIDTDLVNKVRKQKSKTGVSIAKFFEIAGNEKLVKTLKSKL